MFGEPTWIELDSLKLDGLLMFFTHFVSRFIMLGAACPLL